MQSNEGGSGGNLKVGIVGCGTIAAAHIPYIRGSGGELVGVADMSLRQASELADRFDVQRVYRGLSDLLECEQPDVLHVLTPPHTHARLAVEALERGIHTLIEKPMAIDGAECDLIAAAAERGQALVCADHNRLFDPPMLKARQLLADGALGNLVAVESYQAGAASERDWLATLSGGGLGDLIPHPLYLQLAFLGEVRDLHAVAFDVAGDGSPRELRVFMQGDRCSGFLTISMNASPGLNTLKLCGSKMTVEVNLNNMTIVRRRDYDVPKVIGKSLPNLDESYQLLSQMTVNVANFVRGKIRYYPGMGELISRFYDAVRGGRQAPVSMEEGAAVVRVTERIWRQAAIAPEQSGGIASSVTGE